MNRRRVLRHERARAESSALNNREGASFHPRDARRLNGGVCARTPRMDYYACSDKPEIIKINLAFLASPESVE